MTAAGPFDVKLTPQPPGDDAVLGGTMTRGNGQLTVTVVPDSGTDALVGLSRSMQIDMSGGKHAYVFEYTFADAA